MIGRRAVTVRLCSETLRECGHRGLPGLCRFCCKSIFAQVTKNSPGCRRDFRVKIWGTSSPDDKLVSDLAKAAEATKVAARRSDRLTEEKLSPRNFGFLQQYLP